MTEDIDLNTFKKMIKKLGYKPKTRLLRSSQFDKDYVLLEVYDMQGNFIVGSGANVYQASVIEANKPVFDLLTKYIGRVWAKNYNPPLKVLF